MWSYLVLKKGHLSNKMAKSTKHCTSDVIPPHISYLGYLFKNASVVAAFSLKMNKFGNSIIVKTVTALLRVVMAELEKFYFPHSGIKSHK